MSIQNTLTALIFGALLIACDTEAEKTKPQTKHETLKAIDTKPPIDTPEGMVWVGAKTFIKGAKENDSMAMRAEKPAHEVYVDGFFIDATEVTNAQFEKFIEATGYITLAERDIDWGEMKTSLPPGTPKPADSLLLAGSLMFNQEVQQVQDMNQHHQWWTWKIGANWRHPEGPNSSIENKENYPVVHIAYEDALAYCEWANRRLPTEAEWESAALGSQDSTVFTWGNDASKLNENANTWQGIFPVKNESKDGFELIAPAASFPPNSIGVYDMLGNVWELTSDLFNVDYYASIDASEVLKNPSGAKESYSPNNPLEEEVVIKGGSFLCHASYCASFRISARMGNAKQTSSDHVGFRTVATPEMLAP